MYSISLFSYLTCVPVEQRHKYQKKFARQFSMSKSSLVYGKSEILLNFMNPNSLFYIVIFS